MRVSSCITLYSKLHIIFSLFDRTIATLILHAINLAFAKIPLGVHTIWACLATSAVLFVLSFLLRLGVSTILPFEVPIVGVLTMIVSDILYGMIKFIPVKDKRTGQTKRWAIGTFFCLPFLMNNLCPILTFLQLYDTQYRNVASHARITSIRSQSESCRKAWHSNIVRSYRL